MASVVNELTGSIRITGSHRENAPYTHTSANTDTHIPPHRHINAVYDTITSCATYLASHLRFIHTNSVDILVCSVKNVTSL